MNNERLEILIGKEKLDLLRTKSVAVFGIGGVGSYSAEALARTGIGKILLCDFDVVSPSNLNRQIIALTTTIGERKTEVMKKRILEINPECEVVTYPVFLNKETIAEILKEKPDAAIDAIDVMTSKAELIRQLEEAGIPFISSLGMGGRMDPTKIKITVLKKTTYDRLAKALRKILRDAGLSLDVPVVFSEEETHGKTGKDEEGETRKEKNPIGSSVFVPAAAGLAAASYIVRKLIGEEGIVE